LVIGARDKGAFENGDVSTGDRNTGDWNTGNRNTGNRNTGDGNTGNGNTGNRNTGNRNTGDRNTGDGNLGNFHSGSLNCKEAPIYLFDKKVSLLRSEINWSLINDLAYLLTKDEDFDVTPFLEIPNATKAKIKKLHAAHIAARKERKQ